MSFKWSLDICMVLLWSDAWFWIAKSSMDSILPKNWSSITHLLQNNSVFSSGFMVFLLDCTHSLSLTHRHARFMVKFTVDFMPTSVQSWYNGRRTERAKHKMNPDQITPLRSRIEYSHHIQKHERRHTKIRKNFNCNFIVYVPFRFLLAIFLLVLCYCSLYTISLFTSSHFLWF